MAAWNLDYNINWFRTIVLFLEYARERILKYEKIRYKETLFIKKRTNHVLASQPPLFLILTLLPASSLKHKGSGVTCINQDK